MGDVQGKIQEIVTGNGVVLFMKGTKFFPKCGFSMRASNILQHIGVEFISVDVLADSEVREGIKAFSQWPTIPQLYVSGKFVGGSDILYEMWENGSLQDLVADLPMAAEDAS